MSLELHSNRTRILLLSANPRNTSQLRLDEEQKEIKKSLDYPNNLDKFEVLQERAVTIDKLELLIREFSPNIVHFSGHGEEDGIFLENKLGLLDFVDGNILARLFRFYSNHIECLILNSCLSETQAEIISQSIPYVVGTNSKIKDESAINFSKGFYQGVKSKYSYEKCFDLGLIRINIKDLSQSNIPIFFKEGKQIKPIIVNEETNIVRRKNPGRYNYYLFTIPVLIFLLTLLVLFYLLIPSNSELAIYKGITIKTNKENEPINKELAIRINNDDAKSLMYEIGYSAQDYDQVLSSENKDGIDIKINNIRGDLEQSTKKLNVLIETKEISLERKLMGYIYLSFGLSTLAKTRLLNKNGGLTKNITKIDDLKKEIQLSIKMGENAIDFMEHNDKKYPSINEENYIELNAYHDFIKNKTSSSLQHRLDSWLYYTLAISYSMCFIVEKEYNQEKCTHKPSSVFNLINKIEQNDSSYLINYPVKKQTNGMPIDRNLPQPTVFLSWFYDNYDEN